VLLDDADSLVSTDVAEVVASGSSSAPLVVVRISVVLDVVVKGTAVVPGSSSSLLLLSVPPTAAFALLPRPKEMLGIFPCEDRTPITTPAASSTPPRAIIMRKTHLLHAFFLAFFRSATPPPSLFLVTTGAGELMLTSAKVSSSVSYPPSLQESLVLSSEAKRSASLRDRDDRMEGNDRIDLIDDLDNAGEGAGSPISMS